MILASKLNIQFLLWRCPFCQLKPEQNGRSAVRSQSQLHLFALRTSMIEDAVIMTPLRWFEEGVRLGETLQ
jgi:hypothetical protein